MLAAQASPGTDERPVANEELPPTAAREAAMGRVTRSQLRSAT
jgi:hypothetical protein